MGERKQRGCVDQLLATILYLERVLAGDVLLRLWVFQAFPNHQILSVLSWLRVGRKLGG